MVGKINLVDIHGPTHIHIDVEITGEGDLLFSGQDVGEAPKEFFGDSDYEYWLRVYKADKDEFLLALIEKFYSENAMTISETRALLDTKGIRCRFDSY